MLECIDHKTDVADCPIRNVLDSLAAKWPLLVIHSLSSGNAMFFGDLKRSIGDVSPKMLSQALKMLVKEEIVVRTVVPDVPPRTLYQLTDYGVTLFKALAPLMEWAQRHLERKVTNIL